MHEINWMYLYLQAWVPMHGLEELCSFGCCTEEQHGFWNTWNYMWNTPDEIFRAYSRPDLVVSRK